MATVARGERRAPKATPGVLDLVAQIEELQTKLNRALDEFVEIDKRECPGIPMLGVRNNR